ncbi:MAG: hypothetical protein IT428_06060 [Planctomycetaceae bacterium]|nr:hypothetical protein [Planctomycetaceae bacterium]
MKLTERRLEKIDGILRKYRDQLFRSKGFSASALESELKVALDTGYQSIKGIAGDLLKNETYREVAVYYMEHSNGDIRRVASEFKEDLAKVYGASHFEAKDINEKRASYWAAVFDGGEVNDDAEND